MNATRNLPDNGSPDPVSNRPEHPGHAPLAPESRQRLLHAALKLFAEKGFAKASTREIVAMAGVNIAAIRYYFGDKAGLYRAAFTEPRGSVWANMSDCTAGHLRLEDALRTFFVSFLAPLKHGDLAQQCMRLHFREMLEPTGIWDEEINDEIKPAHAALVQVLCRRLQLEKPDDDVHRLAFAIAGLALQLLIGQDVIQAIDPRMLASPDAIDHWTDRLVTYAMAIVDADAQRRDGGRIL